MISFAHPEYFTNEGYPKEITIRYSASGTYKYLYNSDLEADSLVFDDSLCTADQLEFGTCLASSIEFNVGANITDLAIGKQLRVDMTVNSHSVRFGYFRIASIELTGNKVWRKVKAYDDVAAILNKEMVDWYNGLFPNAGDTITIKNMRDSFFTYVGQAQETTTLINDDVAVGKTINSTSISGKTIIEAICQINGVFGKINRSGYFKYISLDDTVRTELGANGTYLSAECEEYVTSAIDKVQIRTNENDIGAIVGTGTNALIIENNFLLFGKDSTELTTIATAILNKVSGIVLRPFKAKVLGVPFMEVGDAIRIVTANQTIDSYILRRKMTGIQCLFDEMEAKSTQNREERLNTTNHSLIMLAYKSNELTRTVEETQSTITQILDPTDPTSLQSQITQNAQAITLKVSKGEVISSINQSAEAVTIDANRINLNGAVTANNNVTIDVNGVISAVGGNFENCDIVSNGSANKLELTGGKVSLYDGLVNPYKTVEIDSTSPGSIKFYGNAGTKVNGEIRTQYGMKFAIYNDSQASSPADMDFSCEYTPKMTMNSNYGYLLGTWYGVISSSSDRRLKRDIKDISAEIIKAIGSVDVKQFIFNYKDETRNNGKIVFGAIAQDVVKALEENGLDPNDFDLISKVNDPIEKNEYYTLNYDELAMAKIAYLQNKVDSLEERLCKLEELLAKKEANNG